MKKITIISAAFLMIILAVAATYTYKTNSITSVQSAVIQNADVYTCPMHPDVVQDKPGTCPKCGMDLVLKTDDTQKSETTGCANMDNCKDKGCNKETCKGDMGGCSEKCPMMKDHKDMNMNENHSHDKMDHKKCKSEGNSGCMGH
jgi:hypothetical protein